LSIRFVEFHAEQLLLQSADRQFRGFSSVNPYGARNALTSRGFTMAFFKRKPRAMGAALGELDHWSRDPVGLWPGCPICREQFAERVEHAARCVRCQLYFSDSGTRPDVVEAGDDHGRLVGTTPQVVPYIEQDFHGLPRVWIGRPPGHPGPAVVSYHVIEEAVYGPLPSLE
jgi:hypothetical protein